MNLLVDGTERLQGFGLKQKADFLVRVSERAIVIVRQGIHHQTVSAMGLCFQPFLVFMV